MNKHSDFRYCLNTSTIRECKLDVPREVEVASQAGYQGIELWVSEIEEYTKGGGTLSGLRSIVEDSGLEVPNLIAFFQWAHPDDDERHEGLEQARKVFATAQELGCPWVAAPPFGITDREDLSAAHLADCFRTLLEIGRQAGIKPLLEFWGISKALGSLAEAIDVLALVDDPDGALLADVFHMARDGSDLELLWELDSDQLRLMHVNDYPGVQGGSQPTDRERLYPGDGIAPYGEIMDALRAIGYRGFLSLELFNKAYQEAGAVQAARTGLAKMKQVVEAGG
jgi:sugar phosphate isomerase/epimerase